MAMLIAYGTLCTVLTLAVGMLLLLPWGWLVLPVGVPLLVMAWVLFSAMLRS